MCKIGSWYFLMLPLLLALFFRIALAVHVIFSCCLCCSRCSLKVSMLFFSVCHCCFCCGAFCVTLFMLFIVVLHVATLLMLLFSHCHSSHVTFFTLLLISCCCSFHVVHCCFSCCHFSLVALLTLSFFS